MNRRNEYQEFIAYLEECSNNQVLCVLEKERDAGRDDYAALAEMEARRRGLDTH